MGDLERYAEALSQQRLDHARRQLEADIAAGRIQPVPYRITLALDARELYGPEVDQALGGEEPMVDEWEEGKRVPTPDQVKALAKLTDYPIRFFYTPVPEWTGHMFMCRRSGPKKGCERVQLGPNPTPPPAPPAPPAGGNVVPLRGGGTPGFRCLIPKCPLRGRRQP
ncbi:hypothetical protein, partial [Nonomuraea basaltis]|uniref:hypothetical protein n=1 Tax=Nonomuraea basaltis TaxID=2495887 RepID=UPI001980611A